MKVNKGALAILVHVGTENWSPQRWKSRFDGVCEGRPVVLVPDTSFDPAEGNPVPRESSASQTTAL